MCGGAGAGAGGKRGDGEEQGGGGVTENVGRVDPGLRPRLGKYLPLMFGSTRGVSGHASGSDSYPETPRRYDDDCIAALKANDRMWFLGLR